MNSSIFDDDLFDAEDEIGYVPHLKNIPRKKKVNGKARLQRTRPANLPIAEEQTLQEEENFKMTYKASRHEAIWLEDSLQDFFTQKWFDDVLRIVKGGKEASVYLCQGNQTTGAEFLAAKVYRPRRFRNLRNDWLYREGRTNLDESGREIHNKGMLHAIEKRTEYGRELLHTAWLEHEYQSLLALYEAGADVPRPFASSANAILMEYYGDAIMGAPTLNDVNLSAREASSLFERVLHNIDVMLSLNLVHGDLSAFNILYWDGGIILIDFPQTIHPDENQSAFNIFQRDVMRVCEYFNKFGIRENGHKLASQLWEKQNRPEMPLIDPKILDEDRDDERDIWEILKNG